MHSPIYTNVSSPQTYPMTLPANIQMGSVMLRVRDLDLMTRYYADVLGLSVVSEDLSSRVLGVDMGNHFTFVRV